MHPAIVYSEQLSQESCADYFRQMCKQILLTRHQPYSSLYTFRVGNLFYRGSVTFHKKMTTLFFAQPGKHGVCRTMQGW